METSFLQSFRSCSCIIVFLCLLIAFVNGAINVADGFTILKWIQEGEIEKNKTIRTRKDDEIDEMDK
jgi:hypothetical protein